MEISYRPAAQADMEALLRVEAASFDRPWPRGAFEQELSLPQSELWLALVDAEIAGYVAFWVVETDVDLLNVAVSPGHRRRGLGRGLLAVLERRSRQRGGRQIFLEVRRSNAPALSLYSRWGFEQVGIRKRYYRDNGEDALVLSKGLDEPAPQV